MHIVRSGKLCFLSLRTEYIGNRADFFSMENVYFSPYGLLEISFMFSRIAQYFFICFLAQIVPALAIGFSFR